MDTFYIRSTVLLETSNAFISTSFSGKVLYQEHYHNRGFSKKEIAKWKELIRSNRFSAYIVVVNKGNLLPSEDEIWLENLDLKMLFKAGIRLIAYVSPQNIFNSFEMEKDLDSGARIKIKIFKSLQDAFTWLKDLEKIAL